MPTYDIKPEGVSQVLSKTLTAAEKFGTILEPLQGHVEAAAKGTGGSGAIVPALQAFFENQSTGLNAINTRVGACINGAYNATKAYVDGDEDMITTYQRNARMEAIGGMPNGHPAGPNRAE